MTNKINRRKFLQISAATTVAAATLQSQAIPAPEIKVSDIGLDGMNIIYDGPIRKIDPGRLYRIFAEVSGKTAELINEAIEMEENIEYVYSDKSDKYGHVIRTGFSDECLWWGLKLGAYLHGVEITEAFKDLFSIDVSVGLYKKSLDLRYLISPPKVPALVFGLGYDKQDHSKVIMLAEMNDSTAWQYYESPANAKTNWKTKKQYTLQCGYLHSTDCYKAALQNGIKIKFVEEVPVGKHDWHKKMSPELQKLHQQYRNCKIAWHSRASWAQKANGQPAFTDCFNTNWKPIDLWKSKELTATQKKTVINWIPTDLQVLPAS